MGRLTARRTCHLKDLPVRLRECYDKQSQDLPMI